MDILKRIEYYFIEANKHIEKIIKAKEVLQKFYPFEIKTLEELEEFQKDKLDVLFFRFAKLQDLLGEKIFRAYFELNAINQDQPFIKLLSMLEKEGILEVDNWIEFREIRNTISHDYPYNDKNIATSINAILDKIKDLIQIKNKIEDAVYEIKKERDRADKKNDT